MNLETIITATVVAAFISGAYSLIKSFIDNKAKRNDSILLFKYTKLYEIISNLQTQNDMIGFNAETGATKVELDRVKNLQMSFALAKPLLNPRYYNDFEDGFGDISRIKIELIEGYNVLSNAEKSKIVARLVEANGQLEEKFAIVVHEELQRLLGSSGR